MRKNNSNSIAVELYNRIKENCPGLRVEMAEGTPPSNLELKIAKQPGLDFEISVYYQDGEFATVIESFHTHGYEPDEVENANEHFQIVIGFIRCTCRLRETLRGKTVVKTELQALQDSHWHTIEVCGLLLGPWFRRKTFRIIMNESTGCHDSPSPAQ